MHQVPSANEDHGVGGTEQARRGRELPDRGSDIRQSNQGSDTSEMYFRFASRCADFARNTLRPESSSAVGHREQAEVVLSRRAPVDCAQREEHRLSLLSIALRAVEIFTGVFGGCIHQQANRMHVAIANRNPQLDGLFTQCLRVVPVLVTLLHPAHDLNRRGLVAGGSDLLCHLETPASGQHRFGKIG